VSLGKQHRRSDQQVGRWLQTSPVLIGVDGEGKLVTSIRERAYKTRNLRREPTTVLCMLSDDFFGRWLQIEGRRGSCRRRSDGGAG
jgi:Pyridoxamine 5'-phosphate oxidase